MLAKKYYCVILFAVCFAGRLPALDLVFGTLGGLDTETGNPAYLDLSAGVDYQYEGFSFEWLLSGNTRGDYALGFHGDYYGDFDVLIERAGIRYAGEHISFQAGKLPGEDIVHSPYALYINPAQDQPLALDLRVTFPHFFYGQRWMGLTFNSKFDWPDRSAVWKVYGFPLGRLRFGFEDVNVSTGSYMDPFDMLLPAPSFLVQYFYLSPDRPWSQDHLDSNKNSMMGFFADWTDDSWYAYAQILVDDFNMNRFMYPERFQDQDKIAVSLGGHWDLDEHLRLSCYLAGATKYTFAAFGTGSSVSDGVIYPYGYTAQPGNAYWYNDQWNAINVRDNALGYIHGENNIAILLKADSSPLAPFTAIPVWLKPLTSSARLEFVITGNQSPGNPWYEAYDKTQLEGGLHILDDPLLNKQLSLTLENRLPLSLAGGTLTLGLDLSIGYIWNRFALDEDAPTVEPTDPVNGQPWFVPGTDSSILAAGRISVFYKVGF